MKTERTPSWPRWISRRQPQITVETARVPSYVRVYAVGDIHGRFDLLTALLQLIEADAANTGEGLRKFIIYLGDYVDRGLQSREVLDLLIQQPLEDFEQIYLRGNHDQVFFDILSDPSGAPAWLRFGGDATLYSYGVRTPEDVASSERIRWMWERLVEAVPASHRDFLRNSRFACEIGDYLFCHAGIDPGKALAEQTPEDFMWVRGEFLDADFDFGRVIVHGHSISPKPDVRLNRIGIDTGACYSNNLTCLVVDGSGWRFLSTADA